MPKRGFRQAFLRQISEFSTDRKSRTVEKRINGCLNPPNPMHPKVYARKNNRYRSRELNRNPSKPEEIRQKVVAEIE
jgi:hypothetical protein